MKRKQMQMNRKRWSNGNVLKIRKADGTGIVKAIDEESIDNTVKVAEEVTVRKEINPIQKERASDSYDEKSMIVEQNRQLRERKKKKNRRKRRISAGILMLCAAGGVWYLFWGRKLTQTNESSMVQVTASPGQEIVYACLDRVNGNEISYTVAKETVTTGTGQPDMGNTGQGGTGQKDMGNTWTEQTDGVGQRDDSNTLEGKNTSITSSANEDKEVSHIQDTSYPQDTSGISDMPQMGVMIENGDSDAAAAGSVAEGSMGGSMSDAKSGMQHNKGAFTYNNTVYQLTEEKSQDMIPVGTPVTTRLGTVTTFSRLSAGDYVALVIEQEGDGRVIAAVYIVG